MDASLEIVIVSVFSLITSISLVVYSIMVKRFIEYKWINFSSVMILVSLLSFYFSYSDRVAIQMILIWMSFSSLSLSIILYLKSVLIMHKVEIKIGFIFNVSWSVFVGIIIAIISNSFTLVYRGFAFDFILIVPLVSFFILAVQQKLPLRKMLLVFQLEFLLLMISFHFFFTIYNLIFRNPEIALFTEFVYMISVIIIANLYLSFFLERNRLDLKALEQENIIIELSNQKIQRLSEIDPLTNIFNRSKAYELFDKLKRDSPKNNNIYLVLMIDVDRLKYINDKFGHNVGDEILIYISTGIKNLIRNSDFLARWGGDEFLLVLSDMKLNKMNTVVEKISSWFLNNPHPMIDIDITLSIGGAEYNSSDDIEHIIQLADKNMYICKEKNRKLLNSINKK